jgi:hypothetical protein
VIGESRDYLVAIHIFTKSRTNMQEVSYTSWDAELQVLKMRVVDCQSVISLSGSKVGLLLRAPAIVFE